MSLRIWRPVCVAFGFILAGCGLILGFYVFPKVVDEQIDDTLKLVNGTEAYERWETLPIPIQLKVYFFNVTNSEDVQNGAKPIVQEVGPYVYNEYRHKYSIIVDEDNGNGTLSYNQTQLFSFNPEASHDNKEDDVITIVHLPLLIISMMAEERSKMVVETLNRAVPDLFDHPKNVFLTTTVKKLLFDGVPISCDKKNGIVKIICKEIRKTAPLQLKLPPENETAPFIFSLLSYKNNTHDGRYKISSGVKDISTLAEIYTWNNSTKTDVWQPNSTCNDIHGTDTTIFPPHQSENTKITIFQSDICRSVTLHYKGETEYKDIKGLKYVVESEFLGSGSQYPENKCYCVNKTKGITDDNGCLLDGALELYNCLKVPIVITMPHFYLTHEKYKNAVDGLNPDKSKHETFAELEPKSGVVLRGSKRIQFNIFIRPISGIELTKNLTEVLMPVFWLDEGAQLDDPRINILYDSLLFPMKILDGVYWAMIGLGLAIGFIGIVWLMLFSKKQKNVF